MREARDPLVAYSLASTWSGDARVVLRGDASRPLGSWRDRAPFEVLLESCRRVRVDSREDLLPAIARVQHDGQMYPSPEETVNLRVVATRDDGIAVQWFVRRLAASMA